jgi:hypothetical protein
MAELFDKRDATAALDLLSPTAEPDTERALVRQRSLQVRDRYAPGHARHDRRSSFMTSVMAPFAFLRRPMSALPIAALALLVLGLATPPGQSLAGQFLTIFRVQSSLAVSIGAPGGSDLAGIPDLTKFGDMSPTTRVEPHMVTDAATATTAVGFPVKVPGTLPAGIDRTPSRVEVTSAHTVTFTFRADKTRAYLDSIGRRDFKLPAKFDGASIQVNVPAAAVLVFSAPGAVVPSSWVAPTDQTRPVGRPAGIGAALNSVMVVEAKAPTVDAAGVSFEELRDFMLSLPGLPPETAAQIRAIGDLNTTLPVPVPNTATARKVQVNGGPGLIVAEQSTKLAGGVVWQKDGIVYAVGGPLNEGDLMSIAGSLR